jgi:hypothetical protein
MSSSRGWYDVQDVQVQDVCEAHDFLQTVKDTCAECDLVQAPPGLHRHRVHAGHVAGTLCGSVVYWACGWCQYCFCNVVVFVCSGKCTLQRPICSGIRKFW